ncbi:MAG: undecaprenyl diphosphate synthase family protein [Christensenellales bacterium]
MVLNIALNYGPGRSWCGLCSRLPKRPAKMCFPGRKSAKRTYKRAVYRIAAGSGSADRTSGEQRLSNFMLWQLYTEFVFTDCHWPDFTNQVYWQCLCEYMARDRRFGAIGGK